MDKITKWKISVLHKASAILIAELGKDSTKEERVFVKQITDMNDQQIAELKPKKEEDEK